MPEEVEIETKELQETIEELREERAERQSEERAAKWIGWISLSTALLAVLAAVAALLAGSLVNEALILKNNSILKQAQASDQWAYYQAKGIKGNSARQTAGLMALLPGGAANVAKWEAEARRYGDEQKEITEKAKELENERDKDEREAEHLMHRHHTFAYCVTCTQVAIALSAVAALTKRKPVWYTGLVLGVIGLIVFISGFLPAPT